MIVGPVIKMSDSGDNQILQNINQQLAKYQKTYITRTSEYLHTKKISKNLQNLQNKKHPSDYWPTINQL